MSHVDRQRLVVLGLDGLPLGLARELCRRHPDLFPNLQRLAHQARSITAELPEVSPVNWSSFATAQGPEQHGVLGFTRIDPRTYDIAIADSTWLRCPTIFERLGERGLVSRVLNLPNMYPARPLRGMLVAGFVAPELSRAVFPPFLAMQLQSLGYRIEADTERGRNDPDFLFAELRATLAGRLKALELLWADLAWDLFVFVLTETDRLFHFHFPDLLQEQAPLHDACLEIMHQWDCAIGQLLQRYDALPEPKRLIALADHGFQELRMEVDINAWLADQGLLRLHDQSRGELDAGCILPESKAFALDPGRVYLHDQRFARGQVTRREKQALLERIRHGLLALRYEGRPVLEAVHQGSELYPGAPADVLLPDLVCQAATGFDCKAKFDRRDIFGLHGRKGAHTVSDAFFCDSLDSQGPHPERVRDVGRQVLEHFGLALQDKSQTIIHP